VVLVATVRALKMHGGGSAVVAGNPLPEEYTKENLELVQKGVANMQHHVRSALKYGVPVVVAINKFTSDTPAEIEIVTRAAKEAGAADAVLANHWAEGGAGAEDLARAVKKACKEAKRENFKFLYPLEMPLKEKIQVRECMLLFLLFFSSSFSSFAPSTHPSAGPLDPCTACSRQLPLVHKAAALLCVSLMSLSSAVALVLVCVSFFFSQCSLFPCFLLFFFPVFFSFLIALQTIAREMYGAKDVEFSPLAEEQLERYTKQGFAGLPICVAKTHVSPHKRTWMRACSVTTAVAWSSGAANTGDTEPRATRAPRWEPIRPPPEAADHGRHSCV
jgi:hypothetical protein